MLLYSMLPHGLQFASTDRHELLVMQRQTPPPPLRAQGETASPLDAVCMKLLAKDAGERFANATALLDALPA